MALLRCTVSSFCVVYVESSNIRFVAGALLLYVKQGEETRKASDYKIALLNKHKDAQEMLNNLKERCAEIKAIIRAEAEAKAREEQAKARAAQKERERLAKLKAEAEAIARKKQEEERNRKRQIEAETNANAASNKKARTDPPPPAELTKIDTNTTSGENFVGRRVAKYFVDTLYYGSVSEFYGKNIVEEQVDLWHIIYDDGDSEDIDAEALLDCFVLYTRNKAGDPKHGS